MGIPPLIDLAATVRVDGNGYVRDSGKMQKAAYSFVKKNRRLHAMYVVSFYSFM